MDMTTFISALAACAATMIGTVGLVSRSLGRLRSDINGRFDRVDKRIDDLIEANQKAHDGIAANITDQGKELGRRIDAQGARIDDQGKELGRRIEAQGKRIDEQGKKLGARIDAQSVRIDEQGKELGARIDAQSVRIDEQGKELGARIDAQGKELRERIDAHGAELGRRIEKLEDGFARTSADVAFIKGVLKDRVAGRPDDGGSAG